MTKTEKTRRNELFKKKLTLAIAAIGVLNDFYQEDVDDPVIPVSFKKKTKQFSIAVKDMFNLIATGRGPDKGFTNEEAQDYYHSLQMLEGIVPQLLHLNDPEKLKQIADIIHGKEKSI